MKKHALRSQDGIAQILLIAVAAIIVVVGAAVYLVMSKNKTTTSKSDSAVQSVADAVKEAAKNCEIDDKDICKFYSSWKEHKYYNVSGTGTNDGEKSTFTMDAEGTDKSHTKMTGGGQEYEFIVIGDTTYTKDASDGKWWKQTYKQQDMDDLTYSDDFAFDEPAKEGSTDKTSYKKIGKEACGSLTCFKYQILDPSKKDTTLTVEYIWFDDKDYQLRRYMSQYGSDSSDMTVSYNKVSISAPSPVKEMPAL